MNRFQSFVFFAVLLAAGSAYADAPLRTRLDLRPDQVQAVDAIQRENRLATSKVRGELNTQRRALKRAEHAGDTSEAAHIYAMVKELEDKMEALQRSEDSDIRALLDESQRVKFQAFIQERESMVGSSRDARKTRGR